MNELGPLFSNSTMMWDKAIARGGALAADFGANFGGCIIDLVRGFDKVVAVEPVPQMFERLRGMAPPCVELHQIGVGDVERIQRVDVFNTWSLLPSGADEALAIEKWGAFDMQVKRVDSLFDYGLDFIKLDVDGAEAAVIRGALETLGRRRCPIFYEYSYLPERFFGEDLVERVGVLYDLGYRAWALDGSYVAETGGDMVANYPENTSYDVILIHREDDLWT